MRDITNAFEAYQEIAAKYQEEDLLRSTLEKDEDNLDIQVFKNLITQVAFETMEQFQTQFNHLSENTHYSANFANLDDLDFYHNQSKNSLINNKDCDS